MIPACRQWPQQSRNPLLEAAGLGATDDSLFCDVPPRPQVSLAGVGAPAQVAAECEVEPRAPTDNTLPLVVIFCVTTILIVWLVTQQRS